MSGAAGPSLPSALPHLGVCRLRLHGENIPSCYHDDGLSVLFIVQAIVGSAGMATRAALVQHQARRDNMADVAAKDNSQVAFFMCPLL